MLPPLTRTITWRRPDCLTTVSLAVQDGSVVIVYCNDHARGPVARIKDERLGEIGPQCEGPWTQTAEVSRLEVLSRISLRSTMLRLAKSFLPAHASGFNKVYVVRGFVFNVKLHCKRSIGMRQTALVS